MSSRKVASYSEGSLQLELGSKASCLNFLSAVKEIAPLHTVFLIGSPSKHFSSLKDYVDLHLVQTFELLEGVASVLPKVQDTRLAYISSRAALYASADVGYSIVKSGVSAGVRSLAKKYPRGPMMFSIAPGLVLNSAMARDMGDSLVARHRKRSKDSLLNLDEFALETLALLQNLKSDQSGQIVEIGPSYR